MKRLNWVMCSSVVPLSVRAAAKLFKPPAVAAVGSLLGWFGSIGRVVNDSSMTFNLTRARECEKLLISEGRPPPPHRISSYLPISL